MNEVADTAGGRATDPPPRDALRKLVGKVLLVTFALTALVGAILTPLAGPIVSLMFERQVRRRVLSSPHRES